MLQANRRQNARQERRRSQRAAASALIALVLVLLVAACADDSGDRQFANDPRTPRPTEPVTPTPPSAATPVGPAPELASPEALVDRRGAPERFYGMVGGDLWRFDSESERRIADGPVPAWASSPGGDRVAVVTVTADGGRTTYGVEIYSAEGQLDDRFDDVLTVADGAASPEASGGVSDPVSLSWSPQGRRLLLAHQAGHLVDIPFDAQPAAIETRASLSGVTQADWSPRGDAIAVVVPDADGNGALALLDPANQPARLNVVAPVGSDTSVQAFEWTPRGDGIFFLEGTPADEGVTRGTIVRWDRTSNGTRIVATGGTAGPTGSVRWFDVSPDGKAIAYGVSFLTGDGWVFSGLYVRSLGSSQTYQIATAGNASVQQAWWVRDGLAWLMESADPDRAGEVTIQYVDGVGERSTIATIAVGDPGATPVASPGATPVGSPDATPMGTPAATPQVGAPAASPVPQGSPAATPIDATPGATPER